MQYNNTYGQRTKVLYRKLLTMSIIALVLACMCFLGAFIKKNIYSNDSDDFGYINAYVGGDAYNYIINAGYFAGYCAAGGGFIVSSAVLFSAATLINSHLTNDKLMAMNSEEDALPDI